MDDVDFANLRRDELEEDRVAVIRRRAETMPKGEAGDCDDCGEYFARTVTGFCGRCRDRRSEQHAYRVL